MRNRRASATFAPSPFCRNAKSVSPGFRKTTDFQPFPHQCFFIAPLPQMRYVASISPRYMSFYADGVSAFDIVMRVVTV